MNIKNFPDREINQLQRRQLQFLIDSNAVKIETVEAQESIRQVRRLKKLQFEICEFVSLCRVKNGLKEVWVVGFYDATHQLNFAKRDEAYRKF